MGLAVDTSASGAPVGDGGASPATFSFTIGAIANPILWVVVQIDASQTVSSIFWNTSETIAIVDSVNPITGYTNYLCLLVNPTTGTHTITINHTGTPNLWVAALSYSGANASGQPDAHRVDQQTTQPTTVPLTTVAAGAWMIGVATDTNANAITVNSGGTVRQSLGTHTRVFDSNGTVSPGSNSVVIDHVQAGQTLSTLIASFAPADSSGVVIPNSPIASARPFPYAPSGARRR